MGKITLTAEAARRIVEAGTEKLYSAVQSIGKPERTQQKLQQSGHLKGATLADLVGPGNTVSVRIHSGDTPYPEYDDVSCPLLQENEKLPGLTSVIISKNLRTGKWEIIHWREHHGHFRFKTTKKITGANMSERIVFPDGFTRDVYCPLLRTNESIESGSIIVVSFNEETKKYEIIETQCPAASAAELPADGGGDDEPSVDPDIPATDDIGGETGGDNP